MQGLGRIVRTGLDGLYRLAGYAAAVFLLLILGLIAAQMVARWTGHVFPGGTDYAGYCMAAASFLAMAYTLNHGAHIRVSLLLTKLGPYRRWGEIWCFGIGSALAIYFAYHAITTVYWSRKLHDISQGQDATPLWIPQLAVAAGTTILAIALVDHFVRILFFGVRGIEAEIVQDHHTE